MAVTDPAASATAAIEPWAKPAWPTSPPDPAHVRVAYGWLADELVVRFAGTAGRAAVTVAIETPDRDYVFLLADDETGTVVGVQVDDLLVFARRLHPGWARLAEPSPSPSVVAGFVADVAELFARHGAGDAPPTGTGTRRVASGKYSRAMVRGEETTMVFPENSETLEEGRSENDHDEVEADGGESEGTVECSICHGSGLVGHFVLEQECGGCAGSGAVDRERAEELDTNEWTPIYSTVIELINALDGRNFSAIDLRDYELSGEDLTGATFGEQQLSGRNLSGTVLHEADLDGVDLNEADLASADLSGASLRGASLRGANLAGAGAVGTNLGGADLTGAVLANVDLSDANLGEATLTQANLTGARLLGANLANANLRHAYVSGAHLEAAAALAGAHLEGALGLTDEQRARCEMRGASLRPDAHPDRPRISDRRLTQRGRYRRMDGRGRMYLSGSARRRWDAAVAVLNERKTGSETAASGIGDGKQALAEALDDEAFRSRLGHLDTDDFADLAEVAENLIIWLGGRGFEIRPWESSPSTP